MSNKVYIVSVEKLPNEGQKILGLCIEMFEMNEFIWDSESNLDANVTVLVHVRVS